MIMVTLVPQNNIRIRMTMNQRQGFTIGPPVDIAILKLQMRQRKDPDSFDHGPQSGSMWRRGRMNFQLSTRKTTVNVRQGLNQ